MSWLDDERAEIERRQQAFEEEQEAARRAQRADQERRSRGPKMQAFVADFVREAKRRGIPMEALEVSTKRLLTGAERYDRNRYPARPMTHIADSVKSASSRGWVLLEYPKYVIGEPGYFLEAHGKGDVPLPRVPWLWHPWNARTAAYVETAEWRPKMEQYLANHSVPLSESDYDGITIRSGTVPLTRLMTLFLTEGRTISRSEAWAYGTEP